MIHSDQPTIFDASKVRVVLSSKADGNTRPEWSPVGETVTNITHLAKAVGLSVKDVVAMNVGSDQNTWDHIEDISEAGGRGVLDPDQRIAADAVVTNVPGIAVLLPVADCNAVAIHDPANNVLAMTHLGWQSTVAELADKIVKHLKQQYNSAPSELKIYISPSIRAQSYGFDHISQMNDKRWKDFLHPDERGVGVDLPGYNCARFVEAGVKPENIELSPVDTATSDNYFSHYHSVRSGEPEGRFALLIGLK